MSKINLKNGFTLIELLVVISIIGLLSSIVLASLSTTRVKAADSAIVGDVHGIRTSAELEQDNLGGRYNSTGSEISGHSVSNFTTVPLDKDKTIFRNPEISRAVTDIMKNNGGLDGYLNMSADGSSYAMTFPMRTSGNHICIDSNGTIKIQTVVNNNPIYTVQLLGNPRNMAYALFMYNRLYFANYELIEAYVSSDLRDIHLDMKLRSGVLADSHDTSCN